MLLELRISVPGTETVASLWVNIKETANAIGQLKAQFPEHFEELRETSSGASLADAQKRFTETLEGCREHHEELLSEWTGLHKTICLLGLGDAKSLPPKSLSALQQQNLSDNTVVIFLGDNGFMMGSRGIGATGGAGKVVPYEESIRVPLIMRAPHLNGPSGTNNAPVSSIDLPRTILRLAFPGGKPRPKPGPYRGDDVDEPAIEPRFTRDGAPGPEGSGPEQPTDGVRVSLPDED